MIVLYMIMCYCRLLTKCKAYVLVVEHFAGCVDELMSWTKALRCED